MRVLLTETRANTVGKQDRQPMAPAVHTGDKISTNYNASSILNSPSSSTALSIKKYQQGHEKSTLYDKLHRKRKFNQMKRTLSKRFLGKKSLWAKLIVHPRHTFRWLWDIVLGMYIILDLWLVPYFIAFHYGQKLDHVKIYLYIQDTFYICDVSGQLIFGRGEREY